MSHPHCTDHAISTLPHPLSSATDRFTLLHQSGILLHVTLAHSLSLILINLASYLLLKSDHPSRVRSDSLFHDILWSL
jgi:hypothetical protein